MAIIYDNKFSFTAEASNNHVIQIDPFKNTDITDGLNRLLNNPDLNNHHAKAGQAKTVALTQQIHKEQKRYENQQK